MKRMPKSRVPALDGLRGIAILLVVASHTAPGAFRFGGVVGVTLFFVLSGYLITGVLLREHARRNRIDWAAFYTRRALRLFPALAVVLLALPIVMFLAKDPGLDSYPEHAFLAAFYLSDFAQASGTHLGLLDHTWSLAVEEQFYLTWPLAFTLALSVSWRVSPKILVGVGCISLISWRLYAAITYGYDRVYFSPDTNAYALLIGCALAFPRRPTRTEQVRLTRQPRAIAVWLGLAGLFALSVFPSQDFYGTDLALIEVGAPIAAVLACITIHYLADESNALLNVAILRKLGLLSYAWYLWHVPLVFLQVNGDPPSDIQRAGGATMALVAAWLSWKYVESPALRLKKRFERSVDLPEVVEPVAKR